MRGTDDSKLVAAAVSGDGAAYGELFQLYEKRIYNYAYGILGNREDASDVAQDAFVRVFEAIPGKDDTLNFSAYLYRTTHNLAMKAIKQRGRFAAPQALDFEHEPALRADPEKVALLAEQQEQTWRATQELAENHRAILSLRELHDMSYQEIADVMEMPRNTVGVLLSRARIKFKEAFRMSSVDIEKLCDECQEMLPQLSAYIDEELSAQERAQVESHLQDCAFCQLALEEMTEASKSYRALLPLLPPAGLQEGVRAKLGDLLSPEEAHAAERNLDSPTQANTGASVRRPKRWMRTALIAAATLVLGLLGAAALGVLPQSAIETERTGTTIALLPTGEAAEKIAGDEDPSAPPETSPELGQTELPEDEPPADDSTDSQAAEPTSPTNPETRVDTDPPTTPTQLSPSSGSVYSANSTVELRWQEVEDESEIEYTVEMERFDSESSAYVPWKTIDGLSQTSLSYNTGESAERWRVTAKDAAGNSSAPSEWWTIGKMFLLLPTPEIYVPPMVY